MQHCPMCVRQLVCVWLTLSLTVSSQRLSRDGEVKAGLAGQLLGESDGCRLDFVDKLLRLLFAPSGSEPEHHLVSIFKLLSERSGQLDSVRSSSVDFHKRLKPEFNPTGWRRKRDVQNLLMVRGELMNLYDSLAQEQSGDRPVSSWQKRNARTRLLNIIPKPKRKPLEFNPTGW